MLGELYKPKGKALETAQAIFNLKDNVYACNIAMGCPNYCKYCYVNRYQIKGDFLKPVSRPFALVQEQFKIADFQPEGVFLSFMTDPFCRGNWEDSCMLINYLIDNNVKIATLSKTGVYSENMPKVKSGMTIVSTDEKFRKFYEPNAIPLQDRIDILRSVHDAGGETWVSIEPYPTPNIWKQDLLWLLKDLIWSKTDFIDFIIFGKWNYDARANDKPFYKKIVKQFTEFCNSAGIRYHVKTDTLKYIGEI